MAAFSSTPSSTSAGLQGPGDAREVGLVAPVLAGPEEEHLHAGLAALGVEGEDVGLLQRLGIDRLLLADRGQGPDAVAQARGALELHLLGKGGHVVAELLHHRAALAGEEVVGLADQLVVFGRGDQVDAGR